MVVFHTLVAWGKNSFVVVLAFWVVFVDGPAVGVGSRGAVVGAAATVAAAVGGGVGGGVGAVGAAHPISKNASKPTNAIRFMHPV